MFVFDYVFILVFFLRIILKTIRKRFENKLTYLEAVQKLQKWTRENNQETIVIGNFLAFKLILERIN